MSDSNQATRLTQKLLELNLKEFNAKLEAHLLENERNERFGMASQGQLDEASAGRLRQPRQSSGQVSERSSRKHSDYEGIMHKYYSPAGGAVSIHSGARRPGPDDFVLEQPSIKEALVLNPEFVDKNVHATMQRLYSYRIHQRKLAAMKYELDMKKSQGIPADHTQMTVRRRVNRNRIITKSYIKKGEEEELADNNAKIFLSINTILNRAPPDALPEEEITSNSLRDHKSMHHLAFAKECQRINNENNKLINRIIRTKPVRLHTKDFLEQEFIKNLPARRKSELGGVPSGSPSGFTTVEAVVDLNLGVIDRLRNQSELVASFGQQQTNIIDYHVKNAYKERSKSVIKSPLRRMSSGRRLPEIGDAGRSGNNSNSYFGSEMEYRGAQRNYVNSLRNPGYEHNYDGHYLDKLSGSVPYQNKNIEKMQQEYSRHKYKINAATSIVNEEIRNRSRSQLVTYTKQQNNELDEFMAANQENANINMPNSEVASDLVEQSIKQYGTAKTALERAPQLTKDNNDKATSRDLAPGPTGSTQEHTAADNTLNNELTLDAEQEASSPLSPSNFRIQPNVGINKKENRPLFSHHAKNQLSQVVTTSSGKYSKNKQDVLSKLDRLHSQQIQVSAESIDAHSDKEVPIRSHEDAKRFKMELKKQHEEQPTRKYQTNKNSSARKSEQELMAVSLRQSFHDTNAQLHVSNSVLGHAPSGSASGEVSENQQQPKSKTSGGNDNNGATEAERFNMATYNLGHSKESPRTKGITQPVLTLANPPPPQVIVHDRIDEKTDEGEP